MSVKIPAEQLQRKSLLLNVAVFTCADGVLVRAEAAPKFHDFTNIF